MAPPDRQLSEAARECLRLHLAGDRRVTDVNRMAYRELEAARVVYHTHPFTGGDAYRISYWGYKLKDELLTAPASPTPVPEGSPSLAC